MNLFKVNLTVSDEFEKSEVTVHTYDAKLGNRMVDYIYHFSDSPEVISLKTTKGYQMINQADILFLEAFQREIIIHVQEKKELSVRIPLSKIAENLDPQKFVQVSKSTIVNIRKLKHLEIAFSGNYYGFIDSTNKIVISRRYISNLKKKLNILGGIKNETN